MSEAASRGKDKLEVGGLTATPASKVTGTLQALELVDGTLVEYPLVLMCGALPGPTVYVGAAIHGDEVNSVEIAHEVIRRLEPAEMKGNLICVPMQNPLALRMQHRLPLQLLSKSPMDQFPGDPWMCFPGDPAGNSAQVMAHRLFDLIKLADAVIDIHTPTTGGRYVPFIFLPPPTTDVWKETLAMARAFAPDFILEAEEGVYVLEGTLHVTAARHGIPAFGLELGEGGRVELDAITRGTEGVLNVLRHLGVIDGSPVASRPSRMIKSMTALRAARGGMLHVSAKLGSELVRGQEIAQITDRFGDVVETIVAVHDGPFMRITTFPTVTEGERVAQIGVVSDSD